MNDNNNHSGLNAGHVLLALVGGAIAGAGVAYLTAPASGAETRQRMRGMAHETNIAMHRMPDAVRRATEAARDAFVEALELEEAPVTMSHRTQKAVAAKGAKSSKRA
jgi:gas vesicle protein